MTFSESNQPIAAIGKLLFFDYNKNRFGFIEEIKCLDGTIVEKAYVSEHGLATSKPISDGELVTLILNKGHRGYYAVNVKELSEITLKEIPMFYELVTIKILEKAIFNSVKNNYENLDFENKARVQLQSATPAV